MDLCFKNLWTENLKYFENFLSQNFHSVNLTVTNVTTVGLSKYTVTNLRFTIDDRKLVLGLTYPQLTMTGLHETNATLNDRQLTGKGKFTATVTSENCDTVHRTYISICFHTQICTSKLRPSSHPSRSSTFRPSISRPWRSAKSLQISSHLATERSMQLWTEITTPVAQFGLQIISTLWTRKCQTFCWNLPTKDCRILAALPTFCWLW